MIEKMNAFVFRHAERCGTQPYVLTTKGTMRAQYYSQVLLGIFEQVMGESCGDVFYSAPLHGYGIQCQQTVLPITQKHDMILHGFSDICELRSLPHNALICAQHRSIVHIVNHLIKDVTSAVRFPFYWSDNNFCTVLVIKNGIYHGAIIVCLPGSETQDHAVFSAFQAKHIFFFQQCYITNKKYLIPFRMITFLENMLFELPELQGHVNIFGGWVRNILQNDVDSQRHDVDVEIMIPCGGLDSFFRNYRADNTIITITQNQKNHVVYKVVFLDTHEKMDISEHSYDEGYDFTCNTGYIPFPFHGGIQFHHPNGRKDLDEYRLVPFRDEKNIPFFRWYKMYTLGYHCDNKDVLDRLKKRIECAIHTPYEEDTRDAKNLLPFVGLHSEPQKTLLSSRFETILLLGGRDSNPSPELPEWIDAIDRDLSTTGVIYSGIYEGEIRIVIDELLGRSRSRSLILVDYRDEFKKTHPFKASDGRVSIVNYDNLVLRTYVLLFGKPIDHTYVFRGSHGTRFEIDALDISKTPYSTMYTVVTI